MDFKKQKDYLIDNALSVFFIGMFISLSDGLFGRIGVLGSVVMLISFYLMYLKSKKSNDWTLFSMSFLLGGNFNVVRKIKWFTKLYWGLWSLLSTNRDRISIRWRT